MLRRLRVWRTIQEANRPAPTPQRWIQYACQKRGEIVEVYTTDASMGNDPIYGRSEGARSVGRLMLGDQPISNWRPVFNGDLATHRYSPSED